MDKKTPYYSDYYVSRSSKFFSGVGDTELPVTSKNWWGKSNVRYRSSLGYSESTLYDYNKLSYVGYRSTFTNPENEEQVKKLLISSYNAVREIVVILDLPFKVKICFSSDTFFKAHSDTVRHLFISTECLDNEKISDSEKIDILCGIGVHESAHIKYSVVRTYMSFKKTLEDDPSRNKEFILLLFNILEDERVEDLLLKDRPGYLMYIANRKSWEYKGSVIEFSNYTDQKNIFYKIIKFIRYRDKWNEEGDVDTVPSNLEDLFGKIKDLLEPIYESNLNTKDICSIAVKLYDLLTSDTNLGLTESHIESIKTKLKNYTPLYSGQDLDIKDIDYKYLFPTASSFMTNLVDTRYLQLVESISDGSIVVPKKDHYFIKVNNDDESISSLDIYKYNYNKIKGRISKYVPSIRRLMIAQSRNYDFVIHGCRYGLLDTTKLAEAYQGVPQVYIRKGVVKTSNLAICILIDESGSMGGRKIVAARDAAVLLNEAFSGVPGIDLFIYGHTADILPNGSEYYGAVDITIYKEPNSGGADYNLSRISAKDENRDGLAILDVVNRLRSFTSEYCIMFVISDGEPSAVGYRGFSAIKDTRLRINDVESKYNTDIVGICIENYGAAKDIYTKYLDLSDDLSEFPKALGKVIKNLVLKTRETITS